MCAELTVLLKKNESNLRFKAAGRCRHSANNKIAETSMVLLLNAVSANGLQWPSTNSAGMLKFRLCNLCHLPYDLLARNFPPCELPSLLYQRYLDCLTNYHVTSIVSLKNVFILGFFSGVVKRSSKPAECCNSGVYGDR